MGRLVPFAVLAAASAIGLALSFLSPWFLLFAIPLLLAGYGLVLALAGTRLVVRRDIT